MYNIQCPTDTLILKSGAAPNFVKKGCTGESSLTNEFLIVIQIRREM